MANHKDSSSSDVVDRSARDRAVIAQSLKQARSRLRWREALRGLATTLWLPVLAAAVWLLLVRFTFLDLPRWPVAIFFFVWLLAFCVWLVRLRITQTRCAHYLDSTFDLDERITTYLELEGRAKLGQLSPLTVMFKEMLAGDTAIMLNQQTQSLPGHLRYKPQRSQLVALALSVVALFGALTVPTQLDVIKQERNLVREALDAQAQRIGDLRAEIVARPDLPENLKQDIATELDALQQQLLAEQTDRSSALATIASAEERLRNLAPAASSTDFEPITLASDLLKNAASEVSNSVNAATGEESDLSSAEAAINSLKPNLDDLTNIQARALASDLERAAIAAAVKDHQLAQDLQDAASAVRQSDWAKASAALDRAALRFNEASAQQQSAEAIESTLSKLEDSSQTIAKAGVQTAQRGQVGFRRNNPGQPTTPTEGAPSTDSTTSAQGLDQSNSPMGQNQPAFGQGSSNGSTGQQSSQGGQNGQAGQSGGGGQSGQQSGPGAGGGGANGTTQGSNLGRVNGPVRVTSGSQSAAGDAAGYGVATSNGQGGQPGGAGNQPAESIYVPGMGGSDSGGIAGQAAPVQGAVDSSGRVGDGPSGEASQSEAGLGAITTINTPYTEVLGQYSEQAIDALDKAYVPPDAKEYVRDYFTALGK